MNLTLKDPRKAEEIQAALFRGEKIEAIKVCRLATGLGLREAKELVEELEAELRATAPDKFAATPGPERSLGSAAIWFLVVGLVVVIFWLVR